MVISAVSASARVQAAVEGMLTLRERYGFNTENVRSIWIGIPSVIAARLTIPHPKDIQAAQMSPGFDLAARVVALDRPLGRSASLAPCHLPKPHEVHLVPDCIGGRFRGCVLPLRRNDNDFILSGSDHRLNRKCSTPRKTRRKICHLQICHLPVGGNEFSDSSPCLLCAFCGNRGFLGRSNS
ncbi:MAG: hypothetical protein LBE85_11585 [Candidatus Accumulibacter sp.]|nr:hypothetical protein [Accumulibacter sp.]